MWVSELPPAMSSLVKPGSPDDPPIHPTLQSLPWSDYPSFLPYYSLFHSFNLALIQKWASGVDFWNLVAADLWRSLIAIWCQPNPVELLQCHVTWALLTFDVCTSTSVLRPTPRWLTSTYKLLTVPEIGELQDQVDSQLTRPFLFQVCALWIPEGHFMTHWTSCIYEKKFFWGRQVFDRSS